MICEHMDPDLAASYEEMYGDGLCIACSRALHDNEHPTLTDGCEQCRLRSLQWSPAAHPSRPSAYKVPSRTPNNSWEKGIVGEHRADGSFMPYLYNGHEMGVKEKADMGSSGFKEYVQQVHSG